MAHLHPGIIAFLMIIGFVASFVDSIAGGGGLISMPALLLTGLPPSVVLGTNKLAGTLSSLTSSLSYLKSGKVQFRLIRYLFPLSLVGAAGGALTARSLPSGFLKPIVIGLLIVMTFYTVMRKDVGSRATTYQPSVRTTAWGAAAATGIGFYDGFFGPGTGSFLIFIFVLMKFDFIHASGNAKALNFASNIAALVTFIAFHSVAYGYGLTMGFAMILGAFTGSHVAIRRGPGYIRPIFVIMTLLVVGKQLWTMIH